MAYGDLRGPRPAGTSNLQVPTNVNAEEAWEFHCGGRFGQVRSWVSHVRFLPKRAFEPHSPRRFDPYWRSVGWANQF